MKNRYIAPAAVLSVALSGCANQQDPETLGHESSDIRSISITDGARLRESPEYVNPDNSKRGLGILVTELAQNDIDSLRDLNDDESDSSIASIETPHGVRIYQDHNGFWYGVDTDYIIEDACSTDKNVNPFDPDVYDEIESARLACDRATRSLDKKDIVWINESGVASVDSQ